MKNVAGKVVLGVVVGVALYVAFSIWTGVRQVGHALGSFHWMAAIAALALAAANYLLRFVRWQYYLNVLGLKVPRRESLEVFLAGFSLSLSPGKIGETIKAFLLRERFGIPAARTAPIVAAERMTDLAGLTALAGAGVFTLEIDRRFLFAAGVCVVAGLAVVSIKPLGYAVLGCAARLPGGRGFAPKLQEAYGSAAAMLRPGPLFVAVALSTASWFFECLGFWIVVRGFEGADIHLQASVFIYAAMTIAGALSFLPGGLGVTEVGMLALLGKMGTGTGSGVAAAATFVTRVCTLWFAVFLGLAALVLFTRRTKIAVANRP